MIFISIITLTSCTSNYSVTPSPLDYNPEPHSLDPTITPSRIPTNTPNSQIAEKLLSTPSLTANTATFPPQPTLSQSATYTSQPTLSPEEAKPYVISLIKTNGNCTLPCIWGIDPYSSTLPTFLNFLSRFEEMNEDNDIHIWIRKDGKSGLLIPILYERNLRHYFLFAYHLNDDGVKKLILDLSSDYIKNAETEMEFVEAFGEPKFIDLINYYSLPNILNAFGLPSDVLIAPFPADPDWPHQWQPFSIVLIYKEKGFLVEYIMPKKRMGSNYIGCPSKIHEVKVISWATSDNLSLEQIAVDVGGSGFGYQTADYFKPLSEVSSMKNVEFFQKFQDNHQSHCVDTNVKLWPEFYEN